MNPQPNPIIGNVFAGIISILFLYYFCKSFFDPTKHINIRELDCFNIGYLENSPIYVLNNSHKNSFISTQLFKDCVSALSALGMKKTESKKITTRIFNESIPTDVQEFLIRALRKQS